MTALAPRLIAVPTEDALWFVLLYVGAWRSREWGLVLNEPGAAFGLGIHAVGRIDRAYDFCALLPSDVQSMVTVVGQVAMFTLRESEARDALITRCRFYLDALGKPSKPTPDSAQAWK